MTLTDVGGVIDLKDVEQFKRVHKSWAAYDPINECCPSIKVAWTDTYRNTASYDTSAQHQQLNLRIQIHIICQFSLVGHSSLLIKVNSHINIIFKHFLLFSKFEEFKELTH